MKITKRAFASLIYSAAAATIFVSANKYSTTKADPGPGYEFDSTSFELDHIGITYGQMVAFDKVHSQ